MSHAYNPISIFKDQLCKFTIQFSSICGIYLDISMKYPLFFWQRVKTGVLKVKCQGQKILTHISKDVASVFRQIDEIL